jgi:hypothetical protein
MPDQILVQNLLSLLGYVGAGMIGFPVILGVIKYKLLS